jgi:hypothetical protein
MKLKVVIIVMFSIDRLSDDSSPAGRPSTDAGRAAAPITAANGAAQGPAPPYKGLVTTVLTVGTMGVSIMMAACGAFIVKDSNSVDDTGSVFIGIYMVLFAAILFCYELIQVKPIAKLDNVYKENFGFLYGPNGRGLYMFL